MQANFKFRDFRDEFGAAFPVHTDWHIEANMLAA